MEQAWARYQGRPVSWVRLEGAPDELQGEMASGLAFSGKKRFLRSTIFPVFSTRLLQEDLARIRLFLAREGYPAAVVYPEEIPVIQDGKMAWIKPGERFRDSRLESSQALLLKRLRDPPT